MKSNLRYDRDHRKEFEDLAAELHRLIDLVDDAALRPLLAKTEELAARYEAGELDRRGFAREMLRIARESLGFDPGDIQGYGDK